MADTALPKRIMIVAGEASGDNHGANLIQAVHARDPSVQFFGIGGQRMRAAGMDVRVDCARLAVVGLVEVLVHYRELAAVLEQMRETLRRERPDLLVLIDYAGFNLRLAPTARALGIRVLYYVSPQVWAWRQGRVKTIRECVDMMAVLLPFEESFYREHGVPVRFVGHPMVDQIGPGAPREELLRAFGLDPARKTVGLFPGSRRSEIRRLLPVLMDAAIRLHREYPDLQFLLPRASTITDEELAPYLHDKSLGIVVVSGHGLDVMRACDAIATASGTVTLEIALTGTPMVIIYKVAWLTYWIARAMVKLDHIGLCNIVAGERLVPELIQHDAKPAAIAAEISHVLTDSGYAARMRAKLATVREKLGGGGGAGNIAALVFEMLARRSAHDAALGVAQEVR